MSYPGNNTRGLKIGIAFFDALPFLFDRLQAGCKFPSVRRTDLHFHSLNGPGADGKADEIRSVGQLAAQV